MLHRSALGHKVISSSGPPALRAASQCPGPSIAATRSTHADALHPRPSPELPGVHLQIVTEPKLVVQSQAFEEATRGGDRDAMIAFCGNKAAAAAGDEAETWAFLRVLFESDARRCESHFFERWV